MSPRYSDIYEELYRQILSSGKPTWDAYFDGSSSYETFWTRPFLDAALPLLKCEADKPRILELGCGTGQACCYLAARNYRVSGVDVSATAIAMAKQAAEDKGLSIEFACQDVSRLELATNFFDIVFDGNCLHCIVFDEEREALCESACRLLRKNGYFLVSTMVSREDLVYVAPYHYDSNGVLWAERTFAEHLVPSVRGKAFETLFVDGKEYMPYRRVDSAESLKALFGRNGFETVWEHLTAPRQEGVEPMFQAVFQLRG